MNPPTPEIICGPRDYFLDGDFMDNDDKVTFNIPTSHVNAAERGVCGFRILSGPFLPAAGLLAPPHVDFLRGMT
jgi:hypothetical protein